MEITQLRYFLAACEARNFTQAAARCFTSRQNLTHSIRALERELGVQLFVLSGNIPMLTADGARAEKLARHVVEDVDEFAAAFASDAEDKGADAGQSPLRVAFEVNMRYSDGGLSEALGEFADFPLHVDELTAYSCYQAVCAGDADAAIVFCLSRKFSDCSSVALGTAPLCVLVSESDPLAQKDVVRMKDLATMRLLLLPESKFVYGRFIDAFRQCGHSVSDIQTVLDFSLMVNCLRKGDAVALVSNRFPREIPEGLVTRPLEDVDDRWTVSFLFDKENPDGKRISKLVEFLESRSRQGYSHVK